MLSPNIKCECPKEESVNRDSHHRCVRKVKTPFHYRALLSALLCVSVLIALWSDGRRHRSQPQRRLLTDVNCPGGHTLEKFESGSDTLHEHHSCDLCKLVLKKTIKVLKGTIMYGCRQCNWDVCWNCWRTKILEKKLDELKAEKEDCVDKAIHEALQEKVAALEATLKESSETLGSSGWRWNSLCTVLVIIIALLLLTVRGCLRPSIHAIQVHRHDATPRVSHDIEDPIRREASVQQAQVEGDAGPEEFSHEINLVKLENAINWDDIEDPIRCEASVQQAQVEGDAGPEEFSHEINLVKLENAITWDDTPWFAEMLGNGGRKIFLSKTSKNGIDPRSAIVALRVFQKITGILTPSP